METDPVSVGVDSPKESQSVSNAPEPPNISKTATVGKRTDSLMEQQVQRLAEKVWSMYDTTILHNTMICYVLRKFRSCYVL